MERCIACAGDFLSAGSDVLPDKPRFGSLVSVYASHTPLDWASVDALGQLPSLRY